MGDEGALPVVTTAALPSGDGRRVASGAADQAVPPEVAAGRETARGRPLGRSPPTPVAAAGAAAAAAPDLAALRAAVAAYPHCELRRGARNVVFADGVPGARVMIVGEAPGRDEDIEGLPFVGRSGKLLDLMLAAIGLSRHAEDPARGDLHHQRDALAPAAEPRPQGGRDRHDEALPGAPRRDLAAPEILVPMGNPACAALLGLRGITKLRGRGDRGAGAARRCRCSTRPTCCATPWPSARPGRIS